ncbi:MAG TPA: phosphoserine phosphatase SerB [Erythrobacter sp.]|nr:phosphoserine phosphatase SerB [Erythrobacter sp. HI0074]KZZ09432.1 phosphoserine phosphatase SerB [Erythrobacter sp. HI0077]MAG05617.1 phosphoserine phosphatase SerB [Sphingomonadaceae bacterium]MAQ29888.1 phosphoserine phosphatase SerB [Erythrobacter sp.]MBN91759.1 phosphoserine phosphatase SerB [Erythrobacteraceae bacterium]
MLIARLIADMDGVETRLDAALRACADAGMPVAMAGMLDFCSDVLQISLPDGERARLTGILTEHFGECDLLVADHEIEVPRLFVSDMDSTMIGQECIDELADFAGIKDKVADITERAMRGELEFESALKERVGLLEGLEEGAIATCLDQRIQPVPGARALVNTLRSKGCRTVLVTGGFHHFADPVAEQLGFERVVGNRLGVAGGALTGLLAGPVSDASTKLATLEDERSQLGEGARVLATGDGANDIPMIEAADYGIAYRAKPKAREAANGRIASVELTAILKLLGIAESEWVEDFDPA